MPVKDGHLLWTTPGELKAEAFYQAVLAYRWPSLNGKKMNRLSEWFDVTGLAREEILEALEDAAELLRNVEKRWV